MPRPKPHALNFSVTTRSDVGRGTDHGVTVRPDNGSFRDPLSRVFVDDEVVWRGLTSDALDDYDALAGSAFFSAALERGDIVATERVADDAPLPGGWAAVLRHERIGVLSYPYEWSFEMLRDAARLQLALTRQALAESLITKDASAYNIQFVGSKPVFIDVGSFERLRPGEPWAGYRQFCELFLNPLYVQALRDVPFQPLLRGRLDGITPGTAAAIIGGAGHFRKGVFTNVRLHARAERKYADADRERDVRAELKRAGFGSALIDAQLRNLEKAVERLSWKQDDSTWSDYGERGHYSDRDLDAKSSMVGATVAGVGRRPSCSTSERTTGTSRALPSTRAPHRSWPSTPTTSSSIASTADCVSTANSASCRWSSISPTLPRRSAGAHASALRSSNGCAPTSCCAWPSSITSR